MKNEPAAVVLVRHCGAQLPSHQKNPLVHVHLCPTRASLAPRRSAEEMLSALRRQMLPEVPTGSHLASVMEARAPRRSAIP